MKSLKTITDEGKREFIDKHVSDTDREIICNTDTLLAFLDTYAEKVATETMKVILPEWKMHDGPHNGFRASVEQAFQTFLGKV